jgi:uncharacterized protein (TIGR04255 family)
MPNIAPIAGRHAIKTVSFALEWQQPLQDDLLLLLKALHSKVRDQLPRVVQRQEIAFQIVVSPASPVPEAPPEPRLAGLSFEALQPNGEPEWSLAIERHFLAVNCHVYSRWQEIWPKAKDLLSPFVPVLARECGITVIGLQYIDQFRVVDMSEPFRVTDLFREDSPFLPRQVFTLDDLWHSHHGYFQTMTEPTAHRQLNHINIDVVSTSEERLIQMTTAHRTLLDQPATDGAMLLDDADGGVLHHHMVALHQVNKRHLCQLLTAAVCEQINLRVSPGS